MGNKGTKEQVDQLLQLADDQKDGSKTKEDLVGCLTSIADMANTGHEAPLPSGKKGVSFPTGAHGETVPDAVLKMNSKLRRRLESLKGTGEDLEMIEKLMEMEDSADWAQMRNWLVWCMHSNLDESEDSPPRNLSRKLPRQTSIDIKNRLTPQSHIDRDERMSAQSSMESNPET